MKAEENVEKTDRHTAAEKCRAVLMVWTEQQKASAVCRELKLNPSVFSQWQDRAIVPHPERGQFLSESAS